MSPEHNYAVSLSLKLFRALARSFPYEFRNAYGEEMMQVAEDAAEPVCRARGYRGLLCLIFDVAV